MQQNEQGGEDPKTSGTSRNAVFIGVAFLLIAIAALTFRIAVYGDPRLSIGTPDTPSYIDSSRPPLLSWGSFVARRLFTTNVLYKLVSANRRCGRVIVSNPAIGREGTRTIRRCLRNVALLQSLLSIASWLGLALVIARHLRGAFTKLLGASLILFFGFTPQIAEWDSVLSSESLSLSLFFLSLALLIEIVFALRDENGTKTRYFKWIFGVWLLVFALWLFVRDANLYAIPVTVLLSMPAFFIKGFTGRRLALISVLVLIGLFILGLVSSRQSPRWPPSIKNSLETFVYPFPGRVQFLQQNSGMPALGTPAFESWFNAKAPTAFSMFLLTHPGFIVQTMVDNWTIFSLSYTQPYYKLTPTNTPSLSVQLGEWLHAGSGVFYLIDTIVMVAVLIAALSRRTSAATPWAWILSWLYLTAAITLFISFFGDTNGIMRHVFPSLEAFRLLMWLSLLILLDQYMQRSDKPPAGSTSLTASDGPRSGE